MEKEFKKFYVEKTRRGLPALWETGGGATHTGNSQIIAAPDGGQKRPVYIRRRGPLAGGPHALFIIDVGDHIIEADHHRLDFRIRVWKIVGFAREGDNMVAIGELTHSFDEGEWLPEEPSGVLAEAVAAAREKAACYHCRESHWSIIDE